MYDPTRISSTIGNTPAKQLQELQQLFVLGLHIYLIRSSCSDVVIPFFSISYKYFKINLCSSSFLSLFHNISSITRKHHGIHPQKAGLHNQASLKQHPLAPSLPLRSHIRRVLQQIQRRPPAHAPSPHRSLPRRS